MKLWVIGRNIGLMWERHQIWYDKQGRSITLERWGELRSLGDGEEYVRIGSWHGEGVTVDGVWAGHLWVSTVWLGINSNWSGLGLPIIFETMVFPDPASGIETDMMRYATEEGAIEGHRRTVECLEAGIAPFSWAQVDAE